MSGMVAEERNMATEERNKTKTRIKDIGMFLFLLSPLLIFFMGYEIAPYFIASVLFIAVFIAVVYFLTTILEPKDEDKDDEDKDSFFFWGIIIGK